MHQRFLASLALLAVVAGCRGKSAPDSRPAPVAGPAQPAIDSPAPATPTALPAAATPTTGFGRVPRDAFNRLAVEVAAPIYWTEDRNNDATMQPDEAVVLTSPGTESPSRWLQGGQFQEAFLSAYEKIATLHLAGWTFDGLRPAERLRREAVLAELRQGRPTALVADLRGLKPQEKAFVRHVLAAGRLVEQLFARQCGTANMLQEIPSDDTPSRALFQRNQGPWCVAPATERNVDCNALTTRNPRLSGLYPSELQQDPKFCEALAARADAKTLLGPFTVVQKAPDGKLIAVPYQDAWGSDMDAVAVQLEAAATNVDGTEEAALKKYVTAAAKSFRTGDWEPADEAWAAMNAVNSKWYLRIGPDETYFEPCARKAGFQVSFARIDQGSLKWQKLLDPLKNDMEAALALLAGPPYVARKVSFHLPDFIEIVLNAGDARGALSATIGQSLPNWGPVANQGRGRTVAMTNIGTDPDSRKALQGQAASLFCAATMARFTTDPAPLQMSTVLHEAAHNLGPAHDYKAGGKTDEESFGGPLAATLEELKAQTAALYLTDWLAARGTIDRALREKAHLADIAWTFGHIANGMVDGQGKAKPYSQLAAIQLGTLLQDGAIVWQAESLADNGKDRGCFEVLADKTAPSIEKLMRRVAGIKARGDKPDAEALRKTHVEDPGTWQQLRETIRLRWLRVPKASYVYAVWLD